MAEQNIIYYADGGNNNIIFNSTNGDTTVNGPDFTSPAYDFLNGLSDLGITWTIDNGVINIVGNAKPSDMIPVAPVVKQVPVVTPQHDSTGLVGVIKENNSNNSSLLNQQNVILDNHSKLLKESNDINRVLAEQMIRANDINAMSSAATSTALNRIVELKQIQNAANLYNSYIQEDIVNVLNKSAVANTALSDSQVNTNTKIDEHYDYQKDGSITASDGTAHTPRDIQAKSNAEHHLDKKGHNTMDWETGFVDVLDSLEIEDNEETSLKNLLELLKTTPLELINSFDDGRSISKKES